MPITQKEQKNLRALKTIKGRKEQGRFIAEGVRVLEESLRANHLPTALYYSEHLLGERGLKLLSRLQKARVKSESLSVRQIEQISDSRSSQGLLATYAIPRYLFNESFLTRHRKALLCDNISDPGNLGTLLRSALAFGFTGVILTGDSTDCFAPKVVRSSAGALFGLQIAEASYGELKSAVENGTIDLIASDPKASTAAPPAAGRKKTTLVAVGSEAVGLSEELSALATGRYRIGHSDAVESLNAAIAGSIIMSEYYKAENN